MVGSVAGLLDEMVPCLLPPPDCFRTTPRLGQRGIGIVVLLPSLILPLGTLTCHFEVLPAFTAPLWNASNHPALVQLVRSWANRQKNRKRSSSSDVFPFHPFFFLPFPPLFSSFLPAGLPHPLPVLPCIVTLPHHHVK